VKEFLFYSAEGQPLFHRLAKLFTLNYFLRKLSSEWSNQASKIMLTAGQFARCPVLNKTPELAHDFSSSLNANGSDQTNSFT